jgi:hypothetical protein
MRTHFQGGGPAGGTSVLDPLQVGPLLQQLLVNADVAIGERMRQGSRTTADVLRRLRATGVCATPKDLCDDPCVGTIVRTAHVGERIRIPIRVRNRSRKARRYRFAPQPLRSASGDSPPGFSLAPTELTLAPAQMGMVVATVDLAQGYQAGTDYRSHVFVSSEGCDQQYFCVTVRTLSDDAGPAVELTCPCRPKSRRVHWYHHFYCDPPEKRDRQPDDVVRVEAAGEPEVQPAEPPPARPGTP